MRRPLPFRSPCEVRCAPSAPSTACSAAQGTACHPPSHGIKRDIETSSRTPVVTHAFVKMLAPGPRWRRTTSVQKVTVVEASVKAYAEASAGAGVVLSEAGVKAGVALRAAGSRTRTSAYEDQIEISNDTGRNRKFVVFAGTMKDYGRYRERTGPYSTYTVRTE